MQIQIIQIQKNANANANANTNTERSGGDGKLSKSFRCERRIVDFSFMQKFSGFEIFKQQEYQLWTDTFTYINTYSNTNTKNTNTNNTNTNTKKTNANIERSGSGRKV